MPGLRCDVRYRPVPTLSPRTGEKGRAPQDGSVSEKSAARANFFCLGGNWRLGHLSHANVTCALAETCSAQYQRSTEREVVVSLPGRTQCEGLESSLKCSCE